MSVLKKIGHGLSWAYKPAVNVKAWMGWDIIQSSSSYVYNLGKALFVPQKAESNETFQEALARLQLTEAELKTRQQEFMRLFFIYGVMGVAMVLYSVYLFYKLSFMGGVLTLVVASLSFGLAFRYHFWVFQIKQRKLGCSIREWWHSQTDDNNKNIEGKS